MPALSSNEAIFLGTVLEFFFYGVYCVIFGSYIKLKNKGGPNRLKYPLTILFTLCSCYIYLDLASEFISIFHLTTEKDQIATFVLAYTNNALYAFIDVISQSVLIYRCWVMWDGNLLFVIVPSILATTSFVLAITITIKGFLLGAFGVLPAWWFKMALASFSISLCVNTVVTGLLVFKIVLLHQSFVESGLRTRGIYQLRPLISIIIESGMLMFIAQTIWIIFVRLESDGNTGFSVVVGSTTMIYGITPTIVLVRTAMGRSYDNTVFQSTLEFKPSDRRGDTDNSVTNASFGQNHQTDNVTCSIQQSDHDAEKGVF